MSILRALVSFVLTFLLITWAIRLIVIMINVTAFLITTVINIVTNVLSPTK